MYQEASLPHSKTPLHFYSSKIPQIQKKKKSWEQILKFGELFSACRPSRYLEHSTRLEDEKDYSVPGRSRQKVSRSSGDVIFPMIGREEVERIEEESCSEEIEVEYRRLPRKLGGSRCETTETLFASRELASIPVSLNAER